MCLAKVAKAAKGEGTSTRKDKLAKNYEARTAVVSLVLSASLPSRPSRDILAFIERCVLDSFPAAD